VKEEIKETEDRVKEDRRFLLDAMIMKIMKEQKTLPHNELVQQLLKKINFPIETSVIKQRIESLIEKDYLKRSQSNAAHYEYVA
jgi:predicted transcriptional regulator